MGEKYAPATVRRKIDSLGSLLSHLRNLGLIDGNPLAAVPKPKRTRRIPDPPSTKECQQLLGACQTTQEQAIFALLIFAGLRKSELIGIDHSDLDEELSEVRIRNGKGGHQRLGFRANGKRHRMLPVPEELEVVREILTQWRCGSSYAAIARTLNAENVPTKRGGLWRHSTVSKVVQRRDLYTEALRRF